MCPASNSSSRRTSTNCIAGFSISAFSNSAGEYETKGYFWAQPKKENSIQVIINVLL
jgi:hypothetical protein